MSQEPPMPPKKPNKTPGTIAPPSRTPSAQRSPAAAPSGRRASTAAPFNERAAAVSVLTEVTENAAYANIVLRSVMAGYPDAPPRSRAFVTELVNTALRHLIQIDYIIARFSSVPPAKMKPVILNILRVAVCQIRYMDKVPAHAAVDEAVKLVKKYKFSGLTGFVNGVLRSVIRRPEWPELPSGSFGSASAASSSSEIRAPLINAPLRNPPVPVDLSPDPLASSLSLAYSYPVELAEALIRWLGRERAVLFCQGSHIPPPVSVFTNTLRITPEALSARLSAEGVECAPGALHPECLRLKHTADIARLSAFREGLFIVMDEAAAAAVKALRPAPGQIMADLCAAPGGKTAAYTCLSGGESTVYAGDIHPHKVALMRETFERMRLPGIYTEVWDAALAGAETPDIPAADAVLLDAPCSGYGVIRRHPDIKYARRVESVKELAARQRALLSSAAARVKPGGVLVYCTCTVSREENIDNVRWFTQNFPFKTEPITNPTGGCPPRTFYPEADAEVSPPDKISPPSIFYNQTDAALTPLYFTEENTLQLLPGESHDAFFIARMVRKPYA
jgi:16S rRNA (cytosine967-C5)-methyltransferase